MQQAFYRSPRSPLICRNVKCSRMSLLAGTAGKEKQLRRCISDRRKRKARGKEIRKFNVFSQRNFWISVYARFQMTRKIGFRKKGGTICFRDFKWKFLSMLFQLEEKVRMAIERSISGKVSHDPHNLFTTVTRPGNKAKFEFQARWEERCHFRIQSPPKC